MKIPNIIKKKSKIIKFLLVGISSTIIDLLFLYIFVEIFNIKLFISVILSFLLAVINGFTWNKLWTFRDKSIRYKRQFTKFLFVSLGGLLLTLGFMYLFTITLGLYYLLSKLITSVIVVIWNFLGNKYWTFKVKHKNIFDTKKFIINYSIIIPAYNEERRIGNTIKSINSYFTNKNETYEIIIIDDGSSDGTIKLVEKLKIKNLKILKNNKNRGKGYSVKYGVSEAIGKYILFTDADNSTPIEELDKLMEFTNNFDIIIGSRYCKNSNIIIKQSYIRQKIGRLGNKIIQLFLLDGIQDTQCGFKLFKHNVAKKIFSLQKINGFGFDMEILLAGKSFGYKIKEVPVNWYNSSYSRVRPVKDSFKTLAELIFIKVNYWFDGYK